MTTTRRTEPLGSLDDGLKAAIERHEESARRLKEVWDENLAEYMRLKKIVDAAEFEHGQTHVDVVKIESAITDRGSFVREGGTGSSLGHGGSNVPSFSIHRARDSYLRTGDWQVFNVNDK